MDDERKCEFELCGHAYHVGDCHEPGCECYHGAIIGRPNRPVVLASILDDEGPEAA